MSKRILAAIIGLAVMFGFSASAYAKSSYATSFKTTYPSSPLSSLSTQSGVSGNLCTLCHGPSGGSRNSYGNAYSSNNRSYTAIQNLDSDGDGFTNLTEINAGTFPGNASSRPSTGGDTAAPTVTFAMPSASSSLTVSFTTLSASDNVGVIGYMVKESSTTPSSTTAGWVTTAPTGFTFASAGTKTLYTWAKDAAGNVSTVKSASVTITITTPPPVDGAALYNTNCSDCHGGLATSEKRGRSASQIQVAIDGDDGGMGYLSGLTSAEVQAIAAALASAPPPSDTTPPTVTFVMPSASSSLTVSFTTLTATDNVGVTGYMVKESSTTPAATSAGWMTNAPAGFTFASAGAKTLYAWAKDAAGNVSTVKSASVTVTLSTTDSTPPTVNFAMPSTSNSLTVLFTTLTATDNVGVTGYMVKESSTTPTATTAGWVATAPAGFTFSSAGAKTLYAWAKDAAGNVSTVKSASVTVTLATTDTTRPTVTFAMPSASNSLTVSFTTLSATDNVGVTGYMVKESSSTPTGTTPGWVLPGPTGYNFTTQGVKTLYAWAKDAAGNVSAANIASVTITITTPPPPPAGVSLIPPATSHLMWDDTYKLLGAGTMVPKATLHISENDGNNPSRGILNAQHHSGTAAAAFIHRKSRGTETNPAAALTGDAIGAMHFEVFDGTNYQIVSTIRSVVSGPVQTGSAPAELWFHTGENNTDNFSAPKMVITSIGDVGIGTADPGQRLEVNGGVRLNPDAVAEPKPACNINSRGTFWFTQDDLNGDSAEVCARVAGSYAWRRLF